VCLRERLAYAGRSRHDEHGAVHTDCSVRLAVIGIRARGRHREVFRRAGIGHGNEWPTRVCGLRHPDDDAAFERMTGEGAGSCRRDRHDRPNFHLDALGHVREVSIGEGHVRHCDGGQIRCIGHGAAIDVGFAHASVTDAALAFRIIGAGIAVALQWTRAATIDARFRAILHVIAAGRRGTGHHRIAIRAHTIAIDPATLAVHAIVGARSAAIDVGLGAVFDVIDAGGHGAGHHAVAIHAHAIAVARATLAVHAIVGARTAAIDVRFRAVLRHVRARGRRAHHHGIAINAHAVADHHAALAVHAIVGAGTAAIGIGFAAILEAVIASRRCTHARHGIAEAALAIAVHRAPLAIRAIVGAGTTAIDVRFRAVLLRVGAGRHGARHPRANLADAIRTHAAFLAVDASSARTTAIDVRLRAILRIVATLCGLTNVVLTHQRRAIRTDIAFHARARAIAEFAAAFHTRRSRIFRGIRRHAIGARVFRARLVVARRIGIVVLRSDRAIAITNRFLAITRRLRIRGRLVRHVRLDASALHAIDRNAFIRRGRAIVRRRADAAASSAAHASAAHAAHASHSTHSTATGLSAAAR